MNFDNFNTHDDCEYKETWYDIKNILAVKCHLRDKLIPPHMCKICEIRKDKNENN